jgi:ABC-type glutathione transport system ATPase component
MNSPSILSVLFFPQKPITHKRKHPKTADEKRGRERERERERGREREGEKERDLQQPDKVNNAPEKINDYRRPKQSAALAELSAFNVNHCEEKKIEKKRGEKRRLTGVSFHLFSSPLSLPFWKSIGDR